MKQKFTIKLSWILLLLLGFSLNSLAQTPTYLTVNAGNTTGGGNYQSFTDLVNDLNTNGVSGPVVVDVVPLSGPYTDLLHFKDIPGASATNTIRINGNGELVRYQFEGAFLANEYPLQYILKMEGTKHLTIDGLKFQAIDSVLMPTGRLLGASGALLSQGARNDTIINCEFELIKDTFNVSFNINLRNGIILGPKSPASTFYGTLGVFNCYIANNKIIDNSFFHTNYGIAVLDGADSNIIENNEILTRSTYGLYLYNNKGNKLINNKITGKDKSFYVGSKSVPVLNSLWGIYLENAGMGTEVLGNRIYNPKPHPAFNNAFVGIEALNSWSLPLAPRVVIANNIIYNMDYTGPIYGARLGGANIRFYHNSIAVDMAHSTFTNAYGIYVKNTGGGEAEIKNNIVSITKGARGSKYGLFYETSPLASAKNNIHVNSDQPGNQYYAAHSGSSYATINDFHLDFPGLEVNSPSENPMYFNAATGNLNVGNPNLKANGDTLTALVPKDIEGNVRPGYPTIGAFESVTATNDMSVGGFITPTDSFCPSMQPVRVEVVNSGINDVDSFKIGWSVNGVNQPIYNYVGKLSSIAGTTGRKRDTVLLGNVFIPSLVKTKIKAWTYLPNGVADTVINNDEAVDSFEAKAAEYNIYADLETICPSYGINLNVVNNGDLPITGYSWEYSYNQTTWRSIPFSDTDEFKDTYVPMSRWYRARVITPTGICTSDSLFVEVVNSQILSTQSGGVCDSGRVTLRATAPNGTVIRWYDSETATTPLHVGNSFITPIVNKRTAYYMSSHINGLLGCESDRDSAIIYVDKTKANLRMWDTAFCAGPSVTITARDDGEAYLWNTNDINRSIVVQDTGIYTVAISSQYGCVHYDSFKISFSPAANVDGINFAPSYYPSIGTIKFSPVNARNVGTYEWDFGDGNTSSVISPSHTYTQTGDYYVSLKVENECREYSVSQIIHVDLLTGINDIDLNEQISVYPNPANQIVIIKSGAADLLLEKITIYDMLGKVVYEGVTGGVQEDKIPVAQLASGLYSVRITTNKEAVIIKKIEIKH